MHKSAPKITKRIMVIFGWNTWHLIFNQRFHLYQDRYSLDWCKRIKWRTLCAIEDQSEDLVRHSIQNISNKPKEKIFQMNRKRLSFLRKITHLFINKGMIPNPNGSGRGGIQNGPFGKASTETDHLRWSSSVALLPRKENNISSPLTLIFL